MRTGSTLMLTLSALFLLGGCQKAPQQKINDATAAIDSARIAEAEIYSTDLLKSATISFDLAKSEVATQDKKLFMRDYTKSLELLESAIVAANSARKEVAISKEKIVAELQGYQSKTVTIIDSIATLMTSKISFDSLLIATYDTLKSNNLMIEQKSTSGDLLGALELAIKVAVDADTLALKFQTVIIEAEKIAAVKQKPKKKK